MLTEIEADVHWGGSGFSAPPAPNWLADDSCRPSNSIRARKSKALAETALASRFSCWQGSSGRRYVFTVYPPSGCPAFCAALLLVALRDNRGERQAIALLDTGDFPDAALGSAKREFGQFGAELEFHLHLLAASSDERNAALADLASLL